MSNFDLFIVTAISLTSTSNWLSSPHSPASSPTVNSSPRLLVFWLLTDGPSFQRWFQVSLRVMARTSKTPAETSERSFLNSLMLLSEHLKTNPEGMRNNIPLSTHKLSFSINSFKYIKLRIFAPTHIIRKSYLLDTYIFKIISLCHRYFLIY